MASESSKPRAPVETVTTSWGAPVGDNKNSMTAGPKGPVMLADMTLIDLLAHFDRERIPERVVHAKGAGAHGFFEVTHDISKYCKAKLFSAVGKRTPVFTRFSTVGGERGSADTARDPRGFAVKFYTEEGNWDMTGNNTPVFFVRDPLRFPDLIHTQKRDPATNLANPDMVFDFFASVGEQCIHQVTILYSDRGTPYSYRHMNGYSSHTLRFVNAEGVAHWVKVHFKTEAGIKNFTGAEADAMKAIDADWATRDLYDHIAKGGEAGWRMFIQAMPEADAAKYKFNPFDITKVWPHTDYPLLPVGRLVLNRNPSNYFAETEQAAFSPGNMVPGIEPSPDKMLQARLFSYPDTHRHRLGANFNQLPINCPFAARVRNNQRDGPMCYFNQGSAPNYFTGLAATGGAQHTPKEAVESHVALAGETGRFDQAPADASIDYVQAGALYRKVLTAEQRTRLVDNIVGHLKQARRDIQERMVVHFNRADPEYGRRVRDGLAAAAAAAGRGGAAAGGAGAVATA